MANPLITNYDTSKTFVWANRTETANYTNSGYSDVTILAGTLLGRVSATGLVIPLASAASDGSQYALGILLQDTVIEGGDTVSLTFCVAGDVVEAKVVLAGSDTMETVIDGRRIRDRILGDTAGIILVGSTELTGFDNQ